MKKIYILDTNVLIYDPSSLEKFQDNVLVLPYSVLVELDNIKRESSERGRSAREAIRILSKVKRGSFSSVDELNKFVSSDLGSNLIYLNNKSFCFVQFRNSEDDYIIGCALDIQTYYQTYSTVKVILVTKDVSMRIRAEAIGVVTEDYHNDFVQSDHLCTVLTLQADDRFVDVLYRNKSVKVSHFAEYTNNNLSDAAYADLYDGRCVVIKGTTSSSVLARVVDGNFHCIQTPKSVANIKPRNVEQRFLMDMLIDPAIDLVLVNGVAGSGKTLCTMAAGLHLVAEGKHDRMLITKSTTPADVEHGYLPGSKLEKAIPWMSAFFDNAEFLMRHQQSSIQQMLEDGVLEFELITYIRGRSIMNRFMVVDEGQNLEPNKMRTIITRMGSDSKLIVLGDISQIDNHYLSKQNNGLLHAMERLHNKPNVAALNMSLSVRSRLASLAADCL